MRLLAIFWKSLLEQIRDPVSLALGLATAPLFVCVYYLWMPSGSTTYTVLVLNQDIPALQADGSSFAAGQALIEAVQGVAYPNGQPILNIKAAGDRAQAEALLKNRQAAALIIFPPELSQAILAARLRQAGPPAALTLVGDLTNPYYAVAAVLAGSAIDAYIQKASRQTSPVAWEEVALGSSGARTEFENYVPGILVFAISMLVFHISIAIAREVEAGTLRRQLITQAGVAELLAGTSAAIILIGVLALVLTFATATLLGFHSQGPLWAAVLVGVVTTVAVIGAGLVVAAFSRNVTQAFLIANFPLMLFMFFSGLIFPISGVPLFRIGEHVFGLYDLLPPTHAVVALNKVLTLGASLGEITYELGMLSLLSLVYFAAGAWLFQRTHLTR